VYAIYDGVLMDTGTVDCINARLSTSKSLSSYYGADDAIRARLTQTSISGVVVKFYLGDAKNLTTFFSEADIFDALFLGREPTYHTNSLAQFLIHFLAFTLSQFRGSLVVVNCLVLVNLVATNLIWGDATAIASPLTLDYLGGCHPPASTSTTPLTSIIY
jgi:hypothetical protein